MSRKSKGINAERDLIHKFWSRTWAAVRVAGSGSMKYPSADIIATDKKRILAIECKTSAGTIKYFTPEEVSQLKEFAGLFKAEAWIAVKFDRKEWLFVNADDLRCSGQNFSLSFDDAKNKGLLLEELIR